MKRVNDFIKKNYIIFTIILAVIFITIASLVVINLIDKYSNKVVITNEKVNMYQSYSGLKFGFEANVTLHDKVYYMIEANDYNLSNWYPIYLEDNSWVVNSNDAVMVFYNQNFLMFKLPKYSKIAKDNNTYKANVNGKTYVTNSYLIYDPTGHYYVILDDAKLKYNGKLVELSAMSSISASIAGVTYYDFASKEMFVYNKNVNSAELIFDDFSINLLNNIIEDEKDNTYMISSLNVLKVFKED